MRCVRLESGESNTHFDALYNTLLTQYHLLRHIQDKTEADTIARPFLPPHTFQARPTRTRGGGVLSQDGTRLQHDEELIQGATASLCVFAF